MAHKSVSLQPTFARLNALGPCMIKLCITSISTVLEPSTTTSATATFAKFLGNTAPGTHSAAAAAAAAAAIYHR